MDKLLILFEQSFFLEQIKVCNSEKGSKEEREEGG